VCKRRKKPKRATEKHKCRSANGTLGEENCSFDTGEEPICVPDRICSDPLLLGFTNPDLFHLLPIEFIRLDENFSIGNVLY
jgi:hypothetical protein